MENAWLAAFFYFVLVAVAHLLARRLQRWAEAYAGETAAEEGQDPFLHMGRLWQGLARVAAAAPWVLWGGLAVYATGLFPTLARLRADVLGYAGTAWDAFVTIYTRPLFDLGAAAISVQLMVTLALALLVAIFVSSLVRRFLRQRVLARTALDIGVQHAVATGIAYLIIFFGFLVALETVGIDLSTFTVIAGALSIGVGFGLQNIANNFISGLILLAERPIKVGDRVQVGDIHGRVVQIKSRATTLRTNDNVYIIVPNSEFVSSRVVNWAHAEPTIRFHVPVGVAYGSELDTVEQALLEAAAAVSLVLRKPPPAVRLRAFGASSVDFELLVWTRSGLHRRGFVRSEVNKAIYQQFMEHGITIPFPQQDLHIHDTVRVVAADDAVQQPAAADGRPGEGQDARQEAQQSQSEVAARRDDPPPPPAGN